MTNKHIINSFFILIFITSFDIIFQENMPTPWLYSTLKIFDEVYIILFLFYTIATTRGRNNKGILKWVFVFFIVGVVGNYMSHSSVKVTFLGAYSTIKSILLFWCLTQYDFSWDDFSQLKKMFMALFPIVVLSYLFDILIPTFRSDIGIVAQAEDIRMGLRSLGGLFNRFTCATLYTLFFFLVTRYYSDVKMLKCKSLLSVFMYVSTFKIKDIIGFLIAFSISIFKKFKSKYIVLVGTVLYGSFFMYQSFMPEHYDQYFNSDDDGNVARVVLVYTSFRILIDNMPFGVGFGMFASPTSQQIESPIYQKYYINHVYGLNYESDGGCFMSDTFWPMIFGETGLLGTLVYLIILYKAFGSYIKGFLKDTSDKRYVMPAFFFIVFLGSSLGKPVFSGPPHSLVVWGIAGIFYSLCKKHYVNTYKGYEISE